MRKKAFFEPFVVYSVGFVGFGLGFFLYCYMTWICIERIAEEINFQHAAELAFMIGMTIADGWFYKTVAGPRQDWFTVTNEYAEWHCLLKRKRRLYYKDCRYIAIETFNEEAQCAIIRGDECAMIYLSTEPYPEDMRGHINHVYCSDSFIKFRYTDKLAEALLEVIPQEKSNYLLSFYNRMQNFDSQMERRRKDRRKRKKRQ